MDLKFSTEQEILRESVIKFIEQECPKKRIRELDKQGLYPWDLDQKMADLGWFALPVPESFGGLDLGPVDMALMMESLSRYSIDIGQGYAMTLLFIMDLLEHGTEEQRNKYLKPILDGRLAVSLAYGEPFSNEDENAFGVEVRASNDAGFLLSGNAYIPRLRENEMLVVLPARNEPDEISLFLINLPMEGIFTKKIDILGRRILGLHNAGLGEVRISAENCLGGLGKGGEILQVGLNKHVLLSSAGYVGNAQTAVSDALEYAKQRHQFGRPIGNFQAIGHMLANMQTEVDASRLLVYFAASRMEQGEDCMQDVSMAKYFASETYVNVSNQGMHIMGGSGYMKEYDMQRYARDARIATTESHSSWYHLNMIAQGLGLKVNL